MSARETFNRTKNQATLYAEWPLRIAFSAIFLIHGIGKFTNGIGDFASSADISVALAVVAAILEIMAGWFVFLGGFTFGGHEWFTRIGAAAAIPVMLAAIGIMHWPRWDFTPTADFPLGGMMFQVTLLMACLYFLASTGRISEHKEIAELPENPTGDSRVRTVFANMPVGAHWFLRVAVAAIFLFKGLTKFGTLEEFAAMMDLSTTTSFIVAFFECAVGILILVGGTRSDFADNATRAAGLIMVPIMIGAIAISHIGQWDFAPTPDFPMGGAEFQTFLLTIGLFFMLRGRPSTGPLALTSPTGA